MASGTRHRDIIATATTDILLCLLKHFRHTQPLQYLTFAHYLSQSVRYMFDLYINQVDAVCGCVGVWVSVCGCVCAIVSSSHASHLLLLSVSRRDTVGAGPEEFRDPCRATR